MMRYFKSFLPQLFEQHNALKQPIPPPRPEKYSAALKERLNKLGETKPKAFAASRNEMPKGKPITSVNQIITVHSCKGGVGKSMISVQIALALKRSGLRVGILDADIYGPSIPYLMNLKAKKFVPRMVVDDNGFELIEPLVNYGIPCMSMGFLMNQSCDDADDDKPLIWRGSMINKALHQLTRTVAWPPLDILVVDLPPGTGDVCISLNQLVKVSGCLLVTTPNQLAISQILKSKYLFEKMEIPIVGVVSNMDHFNCSGCGKREEILGGNVDSLQTNHGLSILGKVPVIPALAANNSLVPAENDNYCVSIFDDIAHNLKANLYKRNEKIKL